MGVQHQLRINTESNQIIVFFIFYCSNKYDYIIEIVLSFANSNLCKIYLYFSYAILYILYWPKKTNTIWKKRERRESTLRKATLADQYKNCMLSSFVCLGRSIRSFTHLFRLAGLVSLYFFIVFYLLNNYIFVD